MKISRSNSIKCLKCNKNFTKKTHNNKFCSKECKNKSHNDKKNKENAEKRHNSINNYLDYKCNRDKTYTIKNKEGIEKFNSQQGKCYWCKCKLITPKINSTYEERYNAPTLDRIDNNNKEHSNENTNWTCEYCNISRNETTFELWTNINDILLGKSDKLDLLQCVIQNIFSSKKRTNGKKWREWINENNYKELKCTISGFPIIFAEENNHPLIPSWDRKINNDESNNKMNHEKENLNLTCWFINRGRNSINHLENFIKIFNDKFPKRCKDIKVIYPIDYEYIEHANTFQKKSYLEETLIDPKRGQAGKGVKSKFWKIESQFNKIIKSKITIINDIKKIEIFIKINKREPINNESKEEHIIYRLVSVYSQNDYSDKILYFKYILKNIGIKDPRPNEEKQDENWNNKYNKLLIYLEDKTKLIPNNIEDNTLKNWINTQKKDYKKGKLNKNYIDKLNQIQLWKW